MHSGGIPIWFVSVVENPKLHFVAMDEGCTLWNANIPRKDIMSFWPKSKQILWLLCKKLLFLVEYYLPNIPIYDVFLKCLFKETWKMPIKYNFLKYLENTWKILEMNQLLFIAIDVGCGRQRCNIYLLWTKFGRTKLHNNNIYPNAENMPSLD